MRLGVTGLRGIPGVMGGIEAHAEELYPRIKSISADNDIEITVRSPYSGPDTRAFGALHLWPVFTIRNKYLETILHTFLAVLFLRVRLGCQMIHIHAIGPGLLSPLARLLGMKVVLTHHGCDYDRTKWNWLAKLILRMGETFAIRTANEVIVVSNGVASQLRRDFPHKAAHIHSIPNGASLTFSNGSRDPDPAILAQFGLARDSYVLAVGRLLPEKGFHDLIAAMTGIDRKLVIAGAADHADAYARGLLARASERVIFVGFQSHEVLRSLYAGAALFVLPSYHEGLPIAALEAASMGRPVLLSNIPANLEVALPPTHYFPVGDVDALADKLMLPAEHFLTDAAGIAARFDWDKIALQTLGVIERARGGTPGVAAPDNRAIA
ncbi:glycosyltransferase family 4 protein [soil metagenome]